MAIVKRGERYQVKVRNYDGRWWSQTVGRLEDARRIERDMQSAKDLGVPWVHPRDRVVRLTLRAVGEAFLNSQAARLRPRTLERYGRELEAFVTWAEGRAALLVADLSRALLRDYHEHLCEDGGRWGYGRRPITANQHLKTVQLLWFWAWEHDDEHGWEGLIPRARRIELPTARPRLAVAPAWEEMDAMLGVLELEWARRAAWIQRFTALRISEALQLRWEDVDLGGRGPLWTEECAGPGASGGDLNEALAAASNEREASPGASGTSAPTGAMVHGRRTRAELVVRAETSKGGYSGRVLPMSTFLVAEMRGWSRSDVVVCTEMGFNARTGSRPARVFTTAWRRAGVREAAWVRQQTHAFRKGVISGLHGLGAPADAVEVLAGHALGGSRRPYLDVGVAFDLRGVVGLVPRVTAHRCDDAA